MLLKPGVLPKLLGKKKDKLKFEESEILEIATILHDIGIKICEEKYNSTAGWYQLLEGPRVALEILKHFNISRETLDRILNLIGNHHSYHKVDSIIFQILVEADFIVNIYEDSVPLKSIEKIRKKHSKTKTGIRLPETMYGV